MVIIASNSPFVVPAHIEERRFVCLEVGEDHMQEEEYFAAIDEEMRNGGYEALMYFLKTRKIKSKLIAEREIRSLNIDVDVHKGVVTLTGIVGDKYQKKRAIEVAKATEGTRRVVDNLKLK